MNDFAKVLLDIDPKAYEYNTKATIIIRNKAPKFKNVDTIVNEIQKKLDEIRKKQKGLDRISIVSGLSKYDTMGFKHLDVKKPISEYNIDDDNNSQYDDSHSPFRTGKTSVNIQNMSTLGGYKKKKNR